MTYRFLRKLQSLAADSAYIKPHEYPIAILEMGEQSEEGEDYHTDVDVICRCVDGNIRRFNYSTWIDRNGSMLFDTPPMVFWEERLVAFDYYAPFHKMREDAAKFPWRMGNAVEWNGEKWFIRRFISSHKVEIELADYPKQILETIPVQSLRKWSGA